MNFTHPVLDFIDRTEKLIQQYDVFRRSMPREKAYEVTLLINCLLGLLVVPQQIAGREPYRKYLSERWLTDQTISSHGPDWKIRPEFIKCPGYTSSEKRIESAEKMTIRNLIRAMRNTATHYNLHILPDQAGESAVEIEAIRFKELVEVPKDPTPEQEERAQYAFHMELPVCNLKRFSLKLARETRRGILMSAQQGATGTAAIDL